MLTTQRDAQCIMRNASLDPQSQTIRRHGLLAPPQFRPLVRGGQEGIELLVFNYKGDLYKTIPF